MVCGEDPCAGKGRRSPPAPTLPRVLPPGTTSTGRHHVAVPRRPRLSPDRCAFCGASDDVVEVGALADDVPLMLCTRCITNTARDALAAELRRQGRSENVVRRFLAAADQARSQDGDP